jgi:hypothetical protein
VCITTVKTGALDLFKYEIQLNEQSESFCLYCLSVRLSYCFRMWSWLCYSGNVRGNVGLNVKYPLGLSGRNNT